MTLPQVRTLAAYWAHFPPAALQLARIAARLGLEPPKPAAPVQSPQQREAALSQAAAAGLPIIRGRPDDPMLDLLDL